MTTQGLRSGQPATACVAAWALHRGPPVPRTHGAPAWSQRNRAAGAAQRSGASQGWQGSCSGLTGVLERPAVAVCRVRMRAMNVRSDAVCRRRLSYTISGGARYIGIVWVHCGLKDSS